MPPSPPGASSDPLSRRLTRAVTTAVADLAPGTRVLVAVSGGPDSTALLLLLAGTRDQHQLDLLVAHLDHGLRPGSAQDALFVTGLARRLGVAVRCDHGDPRPVARERGLGLEEACRFVRYAFLERVADEVEASAILLGHTLDDNAETVLLNLVRGTGTAGLKGMRPRGPGRRRRPLLGVRRSSLRDWLQAIDQPFCTDPTNSDLGFTRNRLRERVVPRLLELNPRAVDHLAKAAELAATEDAWLESLANEVDDPHDCAVVAGLPDALARRVALRALRQACGWTPGPGHRHVDAFLALARRRPGTPLTGSHATDLPGGLRLTRSGDRLWISPAVVTDIDQRTWELRVPGSIDLTALGWRFAVGAVPTAPRSAAGLVVGLPQARLIGARVRRHRTGDRFRPLGASGARPIGRYLRDRGVPRPDRPQVPLLIDADGAILWVIGHQIGEAARLRPDDPAWQVVASPLLPEGEP